MMGISPLSRLRSWWSRVTQSEFDGVKVVGWGPFVLPGERRMRARSLAEAERIVEARRRFRERMDSPDE